MTMNGNQHRKMWATRDPRFHRFSCFVDVGPNRTDRSRWWYNKNQYTRWLWTCQCLVHACHGRNFDPSWGVVPQNHLFLHVSYLWRLYDQPNKHNFRSCWSSMLRVILEATVVYFSHDRSAICLTDLKIYIKTDEPTDEPPERFRFIATAQLLGPMNGRCGVFFVDEKHDWFNVGLVWGWCTTVWFTRNGLVLTTGGVPKNIFPHHSEHSCDQIPRGCRI